MTNLCIDKIYIYMKWEGLTPHVYIYIYMLLELGLTPMHEDEAPMFTCSDSIALVQDCQLSWLHTNYSSWMHGETKS